MRIGIITSGGDSPGMNAFILEFSKLMSGENELLGFRGGFRGIMEDKSMSLCYRDISNLSLGKRGGSILMTGRYEELKKEDKILELRNKIQFLNLDYLVVLGGDGSINAVSRLAGLGIKVIGVPATIDNNIKGTDYTLGFDTAVNKTIQNINDIEDTASSMPGKVYLIETLGGDCGNLANEAVKEGAAHLALTPENLLQDEEIIKRAEEVFEGGSPCLIITICEGLSRTGYYMEMLKSELKRKVHITILGHQQRGGSPTALDRLMAKSFALEAKYLIENNLTGKMTACRAGRTFSYNLF